MLFAFSLRVFRLLGGWLNTNAGVVRLYVRLFVVWCADEWNVANITHILANWPVVRTTLKRNRRVYAPYV